MDLDASRSGRRHMKHPFFQALTFLVAIHEMRRRNIFEAVILE